MLMLHVYTSLVLSFLCAPVTAGVRVATSQRGCMAPRTASASASSHLQRVFGRAVAHVPKDTAVAPPDAKPAVRRAEPRVWVQVLPREHRCARRKLARHHAAAAVEPAFRACCCGVGAVYPSRVPRSRRDGRNPERRPKLLMQRVLVHVKPAAARTFVFEADSKAVAVACAEEECCKGLLELGQPAVDVWDVDNDPAFGVGL